MTFLPMHQPLLQDYVSSTDPISTGSDDTGTGTGTPGYPHDRDDASVRAFRTALARARRPVSHREPGGSGDPFGPGGIDIRPASAYEAITRQLVESLAGDLGEIKSRINNLIFMVVGAMVIDIVLRIVQP